MLISPALMARFRRFRRATVYLGDDEASHYTIHTHHEEADHDNIGEDHTHTTDVEMDETGDTHTLYRPSTYREIYNNDDDSAATGFHRFYSYLPIPKEHIEMLSASGLTFIKLSTLSVDVLEDPLNNAGAVNSDHNIEIELYRGNEVLDTSAKWEEKHNAGEVEIINNPDTLANVALFIVKFVEQSQLLNPVLTFLSL